jgi:hypothetical protein
MAYTIPTSEPTSARAGDTWQWTRDLPDFPAPWTLVYTFWTSAAAFSLTAASSGSTHTVTASATATAAYAAGRYSWTARVSSGTTQLTIASGVLHVLPAVGLAMDTRSHARRMLDSINAILEGRATDGDLDVMRTQHGEHSTAWDPEALMRIRSQYAAVVASEDGAAAIARGDNPGRHIRVRFTR